MSWGAVGATVIGAAASYGLNKLNEPNKPTEAQRTSTQETERSIPEWALPYVAGPQIRQWDMPVMGPAYRQWTQNAGEGLMGSQQRVNDILSFGQLTDPAQGQMNNLLGIGSQYSQVPPEFESEEERRRRMAAAQAAQGQQRIDPEQMRQMQEQMWEMQDRQRAMAGAEDQGWMDDSGGRYSMNMAGNNFGFGGF